MAVAVPQQVVRAPPVVSFRPYPPADSCGTTPPWGGPPDSRPFLRLAPLWIASLDRPILLWDTQALPLSGPNSRGSHHLITGDRPDYGPFPLVAPFRVVSMDRPILLRATQALPLRGQSSVKPGQPLGHHPRGPRWSSASPGGGLSTAPHLGLLPHSRHHMGNCHFPRRSARPCREENTGVPPRRAAGSRLELPSLALFFGGRPAYGPPPPGFPL